MKIIVSMCADVMNVFYYTADLFMFICKFLKFMLMLKIQHLDEDKFVKKSMAASY